MTSTVLERQSLKDACLDYIRSISAITEAILDGRDSVEYAAKVGVMARQLCLASHTFYENTSLLHADALGIDPDEEVPSQFGRGFYRPNSPSENPDDFAGWATELAKDRSYGPLVPLNAWTSDPNEEHRIAANQVVDLRQLHAAE